MKNTRTLFLISFFGCFILPGLIGIFAALSIFFDMSGPVSNWILINGGVWILVVYQFIIILITIMLWLTLRLKDVEKITTEDVIRGRKSQSAVKKVETIDISNLSGSKRKEIKKIEKRDITDDEISLSVREVKKEPVANKPAKTVSTAPVKKTPDPQKKVYSAIKR